MTLGDFVRGMLPELIVVLGACVVLLAGVRKSEQGGGIQGPLSLAVLLAAFIAAVWQGVPEAADSPPGLLLGPLVHYVRLGGLGVGILILLCNMHLPVAEERAEFFSLLLFSIGGLLLTAAANDLLVLFFAIELVSVPTYVIVSLSREDKRASEAAVKYFFLGALSTSIMVYGFSFLYGALGHTTMMSVDAGIPSMAAVAAGMAEPSTYAVIGLLLALAGFFFKLAAVPFHVYAPDVYEGAASPVTGMLGFLPKFAGFVAAAKLLMVFGYHVGDSVLWLIWIVAALTMTVGNTLALLQNNVKRILAYSSIAHSGYMLIALLAGPAVAAGAGPMRDGIAAMLFYMVVYGAMNLGAFAVLSALASRGEPVEQIKDLEGLSVKRPGMALAMAVCCFSLMGFPPTAGLLGKVYVFSSAFSAADGHPLEGALVVLAVIGVINSAIGAAYYLRIIATCYNKAPAEETEPVGGQALRWGVALCSVLMILAFVFPWPLTTRARKAALEMDPRPVTTELAGVVTTEGTPADAPRLP